MLRTIEDWIEILRGRSSINSAKRILGDITHYRHHGAHEGDDLTQLGNALMAFAQLQKEEGEKS